MKFKFLQIIIFILFFFFWSTTVYALQCGANFPPAAPEGVAGLQGKINNALDGETITLEPGTYSGPTAQPMGLGTGINVSADRGGATTCMVRIENKNNLTIKGNGNQSILYGEGHAPNGANKEPYMERAGICVINSKVTFDNVAIDEFQKRCMVVYNSTIVVKNSNIEGCDEGGISMLGNSAGLIINNKIVFHNFGGVMLWQNSQAKIINNTFLDAAIMFFYHPNTDDKAHADIINNIIVHRTPINQVDWWTSEVSKLENNNYSHDLLWRKNQPCSSNEYCDPFPGKLEADPLLENPLDDPCGLAAWANLNLKAGSPAIGSGDPTIPGTPDLGATGGPCADGGSITCQQFINSNTPAPLPPPAPPPPPGNQPPGNPPPQNPPGNQPPGNPPNPTGNIGYSQTYTPQNIIYNLNNTFKSAFSLPQNFSFNLSATTQKNDGLGLWRYIIFAGIYIMFIHFAVGIKKEFNLFLMIGYFFFGGFLGFWFQSYEAGLIVSIILSLIFF